MGGKKELSFYCYLFLDLHKGEEKIAMFLSSNIFRFFLDFRSSYSIRIQGAFPLLIFTFISSYVARIQGAFPLLISIFRSSFRGGNKEVLL